ncbi:energy transducer TonB [Beijerinckiaceae bacterium]|nr:energy transducer TonB [Beijerinckiaceae bacterium]
MTVARTVLPAGNEPFLRRWMIAAVAVVLIHAAVVFLFLYLHEPNTSAGQPPAALMIELAPLAVAPAADAPTEVEPGPQMTLAEPEEVEPEQTIAVQELPKAPKPDAVLITAPKPKPKPVKKVAKKVPKPDHEPPAPRTTAPTRSASAQAHTAAAPRQGSAGSAASNATWRNQVYAHLVRHKPGTSSADGSGTASLSFTISRSGSVIATRLAGSAGSAVLDHKALEMVHRANPFPPPPPEVGGGSFTFSVPVHFSAR